MSLHINFPYPCVNGQEDDDWMTPGGQLHMIAKYLSLPSVRRIDANTIYFTRGRSHQQILDKTQECHGGSSVDDLRFRNCDACEYTGDGQVASFISSTKHLKRFRYKMNSMREVAFNEIFEAIGQALTAHYANLEEIAVAERYAPSQHVDIG